MFRFLLLKIFLGTPANSYWSHLPNAAHIDRIIAAVTDNPGNWDLVWDRTWACAYDRALYRTLDRAWEAYLVADRTLASSGTRHGASGAILALFAWDDTGDYLKLSVESLRVLAELGDQQAVLILPAVIAFARSKEIA
jgi:hypothetical protein